MNRKVLGVIVALLAVLVAVWFLFLRDRGSEDDRAATTEGSGRSGDLALGAAKARDPEATPAPRGGARWTLDVDPEGPLRLEGQVLGADKAPIAGAMVWINTSPPRTVKSEDDGTFEIDRLVGRAYVLTATSADLVGGPVNYKLTTASDPVVIEMREGARVEVTVVDADRKPIQGAEVMLADGDKRGTTSAEGVVRLGPARPGWVAVQARAEGFAAGTGYATVGSAGALGKVTIVLRKGLRVSGCVIDEAGKGIAKARVSASGGAWAAWATGADGEGEGDGVQTDDQGAFSIPALAAGAHTLVAIDGEHAPGRTTVTVDDRAVAGIEIVMKAGGVMAGTVVDSGGKPVPFAAVRVAASTGNPWASPGRQTTTDKKGAFELRGLARAKHSARAELERAASKLVEVDLAGKPEQRDVKLVLDVTGSIAGVVVDETGAPVAEVQVHAFPDLLGGESVEGVMLSGMSTATTDGAGAFTIHGLPDGGYRVWAARATGGFEWGERGVVAKTGDKGVRVTLAAAGELVGKLAIDGGGAPKLAYVALGYQAPVSTAEGAFRIKDVSPGKYSVTFRGPEFAELVKHDVEIAPGKPTDLGTITLAAGRRITGKVVDSTGAPVANAKIRAATMLFSAGDGNNDSADLEAVAGVRSTTSDADGAFTLIGMTAKPTNVMAEHPTAGRSLAVPITGGTQEPPPVTLTLKGFGSLSGVVTQKGKPMGELTVSVTAKGAGAQATFGQTDEAGAFKIAKVPEGTHVLQVLQSKMMSMKTTTVEVTVAAGRETKVNVEIPVGQVTLTVAIKPLPNAKVDAAQVFLVAGSAPAVQNAKELTDRFFQGGMQGMKFWFGPGKPNPEFEEVVAGDYSICTIPITGNMLELQQKLQENMHLLKVYCRIVKVTAAPLQQSVTHEVPSMDPLPAN